MPQDFAQFFRCQQKESGPQGSPSQGFSPSAPKWIGGSNHIFAHGAGGEFSHTRILSCVPRGFMSIDGPSCPQRICHVCTEALRRTRGTTVDEKRKVGLSHRLDRVHELLSV